MSTIDRLASAFVIATMTLLCLALWTAVPAGGIWLGGRLGGGSFGPQMVLALAFVLTGMIVVASILTWLNGLYLRITGGEIRADGDLPTLRAGPLETMLIACLLAAILALLVWFLVFAENPAVSIY